MSTYPAKIMSISAFPSVTDDLAALMSSHRFVVTPWDIGLWRNAYLQHFLNKPVSIALPLASPPARIQLGWGRRPSGLRAQRASRAAGRACWLLEDGFLRSCDLGVNGARPLSLVIDDIGVYYDATQPSRLEVLIASLVMTEELEAQASRAMNLIRRHGLSKYNHAPAYILPPVAAPLQSRVLVVDQTYGDVSVRLGGADAKTFDLMLAQALAENPESEIWVKTHPDVLSGKKRGYLAPGQHNPCIHWLAKDVSPLSLLEQMDKVYVVTSQMGFEALMLHKPVICFGQPWYAGWGLTDDRHSSMADLRVRRNIPRSLEQLFAAAYLQYARYIRPTTSEPGTIFDVIEWLARNKAANDETRGNLFCVGMSLWKRAIVRPFLSSASNRVHFIASAEVLRRRKLSPEDKIVIWGTKEEQDIGAIAAAKQLPLWRMEDGFLRSVGLGSDLFRPVSLVLDQSGMYYDPASNSALERMLATQTLSDDALGRAARFKQAFVSMRMSKYNLGHSPLHLSAQGRRVLLVPGQVEDDASIMRGSPVVRTNLALLQAVRTANPDAYILYKAHPDVVAGNRLGMVAANALRLLADQCVADANIIDCILAADEVHTMTSLSGFEALLHGRVVHCYGGPFYAGWGLTVDHFPLPHRQPGVDPVSLDALVFAVMLQYPRYVLPGVKGFVSAEMVMAWLAEQATQMARSTDLRHTAGLRGWLARKGRKANALTQLLRDEWKAIQL